MAACYGQNSNEDPELFPCDGVDGLQQCCYPGETCASNGLCGASDDNALTPYFAPGCAVDDWDSPTCISQCLDSGGVGVDSCGGGNFCCYGLEGCDCSDPDQVFSIDPVSIVYLIPHDTARTSTIASTTTSETQGVSTTAESSITSVPTRSSTTSDGPGPTVSAPSDQNSSDDDSLAIGLGVGLGVGLPLVAGVIALFWFFRRRRSSSSQSGALNHAGMPLMAKETHAHELHNQTAPQELPNDHQLPRPTYAINSPQELSADRL